MNIKEKFATAKEKVKSHPEIIIFAMGAVAVTIGIVATKKQITNAVSGVFEPLAPVDDATRERLFKDKDFLLYQLSENEYILGGPVPTQP